MSGNMGQFAQQMLNGNFFPQDSIPVYCSLHGRQLEYFCYDCQIRICCDCQRNVHQNHNFDIVQSLLRSNVENLQMIQFKAKSLHRNRQEIYDQSYRQFKTKIRQEVLNLQRESVQAIEDASSRILQLINKGEMRNFEKEMEIYQNFVNNKILNFQSRITQSVEHAYQQHDSKRNEQQLTHNVLNKSFIPVDKEKIDSYDKEYESISEQIKFKKEYFEKVQDKILNKIDLSSFQQIKTRILQAEKSLEQYSKDNRIAVFVPNRKQIIMHDLKYLTSKTIDLK